MATLENDFGYWATPEEGSRPGVVLVPDVWGLSKVYRDLAGRLAGEGFAVLVVDPYRKTGAPQLEDVESALRWIRELPDPVVLETLQEAVDALAAHPAVLRSEPAGPKLGVLGFCMGGQYALLAACSCSGLSACVACYGMLRYEEGLDPARKPRSPLEALADLRCPVLGLYGEEDALIPVEDVRELERALRQSGTSSEVHLFPGAGHAFMNPARPEAYRPQTAEEAWSRLAPFLHAQLG